MFCEYNAITSYCPSTNAYVNSSLQVNQISDNADIKTEWLAALQSFHPPKNLFIC